MANMTLADIRQLARGRYGMEWSTSEDPALSQVFLNKLVNEAHTFFAGVSRCYRNTFSQTLVAGTATYYLDPQVIEPDVKTFYTLIGGAYKLLPNRMEHSLLEQYGPVAGLANGTPAGFHIESGNVADQLKKVVLWPPPSAVGTLFYKAWHYPAALVSDTDAIPLPDAEVYRLIPAICWKMAAFETGRGREGAPVEMWATEAMNQAMEFQRITRFGTREFARTTDAGATPLADQEERKRPFGK